MSDKVRDIRGRINMYKAVGGSYDVGALKYNDMIYEDTLKNLSFDDLLHLYETEISYEYDVEYYIDRMERAGIVHYSISIEKLYLGEYRFVDIDFGKMYKDKVGYPLLSDELLNQIDYLSSEDDYNRGYINRNTLIEFANYLIEEGIFAY